MKTNSFLIKINVQQDTDKYQIFFDSKVSLSANSCNENYITYKVNEKAGFKIFFGERKDTNELDYEQPISGSSIIYQKPENTIEIISDLTGSEIVFYRQHLDQIWISNRLENLLTSQDEPDINSIQCYLSFGYTPKSDTFFKNVFQTMPNQNILIDLEKNQVCFKPTTRYANLCLDPYFEAKSEEYASQFAEIISHYKPMVLMMSAGWDSRTLLAPTNNPIESAYTHGDLSSRECTIAKRITGSLRKDHSFKDVNNMRIDRALLDEMLELHGHCLWPIWHLSSNIISKEKGLPITSGLIGEWLGGHMSFLSFGNRRQKIWHSLHLVAPKIITKSKIKQRIERNLETPKQFWFTSEVGNDLFRKSRETTNNSLKKVFRDYVSNIDDFPLAVEFFKYDHSIRQYMMKQPIMAKSNSGYYAPLSHPTLLKILYSMPFKKRVHNIQNRNVIKHLDPSLLNFPMAATLVSAKYPILIQELSRVVRIIFTEILTQFGKKHPRLGWFNYDHLYSSNVFSEIIDSLESDIWSKEGMKDIIGKNSKNNIDAGSTLDMVCKIKTIDYYLRLTGNEKMGAQ